MNGNALREILLRRDEARVAEQRDEHPVSGDSTACIRGARLGNDDDGDRHGDRSTELSRHRDPWNLDFDLLETNTVGEEQPRDGGGARFVRKLGECELQLLRGAIIGAVRHHVRCSDRC